jgi:hypothetical protein
LDHLTSLGLAYSQILLAQIYELLVLVNTVISWIRLVCTMYISFNYLSFQIWYCVLFSLIFHSSGHCKATKKNVCLRSHVKKIWGRSTIFFILFLNFFLLSVKPEIVVPGSEIRFRYFIFEIFGMPSFVEAILWWVTQFFYLCSQFRQKASGWINKTMLLIKQHVTIHVYWQVCQYPISFLTSPSGIQLIISASPNVEITSPGRRASGFFNPCKDRVMCRRDHMVVRFTTTCAICAYHL